MFNFSLRFFYLRFLISSGRDSGPFEGPIHAQNPHLTMFLKFELQQPIKHYEYGLKKTLNQK